MKYHRTLAKLGLGRQQSRNSEIQSKLDADVVQDRHLDIPQHQRCQDFGVHRPAGSTNLRARNSDLSGIHLADQG